MCCLETIMLHTIMPALQSNEQRKETTRMIRICLKNEEFITCI